MFAVLAFVLFVIASVICFVGDAVELRTVIGIIAAGLAALALSAPPIAGWISQKT